MRAGLKTKRIRQRTGAQTSVRAQQQRASDDDEVRMLAELLESIEGLRPYGLVTARTDARLARLFEDDSELFAKVRQRMEERHRAIEVDIDEL